ncbi:ras-related protein Rab-7L1-like [Protopterus annectens]|uniref:ras-related protein Rab-7L1-like n=1 Tax=Protopterus annectens TaxID=7888 RepID=UPI001CFB0435|nr:ras-related protein Rab-7L1-like [Protopterus annectens]
METVFKILVIGARGVGKTSFVQQYVHRIFTENYKITLGADFAVKVLQWSETETIRLHLWDIAGMEQSLPLCRVYYRGAAGCLIMCDVTRPDTLVSAYHWKTDVDENVQQLDGSPIPCMFLANKCDRSDRQLSTEEIRKFSQENNFIRWSETSVKENKNVLETVR